MTKTEHEIIRFIGEKNLISPGDRILIALSGGPDSVFLLTFLNKFRRKYRIETGAFHLNHHLRRDAKRDAEFCYKLCTEENIPFFTASSDVKKEAQISGVSVEEAGRKIRYALLEETAEVNGYTKIALGHNISDNTETVFLNLSKGTGIRGIAGIPFSRGKIIRPLLSTSKDSILEFLRENKIKFVSDKSNLKNDYERNFLRNKILPELRLRINPNLDEAVFRSSQNFRGAADLVHKAVIEAAELSMIEGTPVRLDIDQLKRRDQNLIPGIIKFILERNFFIQPSFKDISSIVSLIENEPGKGCSIGGKIRITRERTFLEIREKADYVKSVCRVKTGGHCIAGNKVLTIDEFPGIPEFSRDMNLEFIAGENVDDEFIVRPWKAGDKFRPIGMTGTVNVSDFLNSLKIPSSEKKRKLVLENKDEIVWVIGYRINEKFKIKKDTRRILKLCLK